MIRLRPSVLALLALVSCRKVGPIPDVTDQVGKGLVQADIDHWARTCAPRELALAESHRVFAQVELEQGDALRAEQHLAIARDNILLALQKADACRPKDRDQDGIMDPDDLCVDRAETVNGYKDDDGCPETDADADGIYDDVDACPTQQEDKDGFQDEDGCPEADNDADNIPDFRDKCPNDAEDYNRFQDDDGCPEGVVDADADGIFDNVDACPTEPENKNDYLDEDGCPDVKPQNVRVTEERIYIEQRINFETGKARILPDSFGILNAVAQVLKDYPKIRVRVEGHTDNQGSDPVNLKLSDARAKSVADYLVAQGVARDRLEPKGLGETTPLDTNNTAAGRANNRRVEFHILD